MSSPVIWGGNSTSIDLQPNLQLGNGGPSIKTGTADPTSVAQAGAEGSLYIRTSTGATYQKQDAGSSTNWLQLVTTGPINNYFNGYLAPSSTNTWTATSTTFITPTITGGSSSLATRYSNGLTVSAATSNAPGITFTPSSSSAVYQITMTTYLACSAGNANAAVRLFDGTTVLVVGPTTLVSTTANIATVTCIYVPGTTSAVTIDVQVASGSGLVTIGPGNGAVAGWTGIEWQIVQLATATGGAGSPKAPTVQQFTSSSGTYTTPTGPSPLYIKVEMVGGGGGGGGSGSTTGTAATAGNNSTFGSSLLIANGGGAGGDFTGGGGTGGGAGTVNSPAVAIINVAGGNGQGPFATNTSTQAISGANGGVSALGGAGFGPNGNSTTTGNAAASNSGSGGSSASITTVINSSSGGGGGAGNYIEAIISSPGATYSYSVGSAGTGGGAGTSGAAGGAGGSGYIVVTEYYQ